jgi:SHS2 domain-containing protein
MSRGWEHIVTDTEVTVRAWGASRAEAFACAAEAVLALVVPPTTITTQETREARAQGAPPEALLVNWLNECLYVHEIEGFAVSRVEVDMCREGLVHGLLHGEPFDPARHLTSTAVQAVSPDRAEVRESDAGAEVRAVVAL